MMQAGLWTGAGVLAAVAVASGIAEHRRRARRDLDRVGLVDWRGVQLLALFAAILSAALALAGGI